MIRGASTHLIHRLPSLSSLCLGAASSDIPHPEVRSPQGEASKDTPQHRSLHASTASAPAPPFEAHPGHLRVRLS
ncbi:UNVERIFIED_ORG: hypothetical protein GGI66_004985 [Rhizobium esperanzae]